MDKVGGTGTTGLIFRSAFQMADGNPQNIRIGEFTDPVHSLQDDYVVVYGDDSSTHILEYGVTTNATTGNATVVLLASITTPATTAFGSMTVMGDGRIVVNYNDLVNPSPDQTSQ